MREGDSGDEIDIPSVVCSCRIEQVSHQLTSKLTSVTGVRHRGCYLHSGDPSVGGDPKTNLIAPLRHSIWRVKHPLRRRGENITRTATRARTRIGARARPVPVPVPPPAPGPCPGPPA